MKITHKRKVQGQVLHKWFVCNPHIFDRNIPFLNYGAGTIKMYGLFEGMRSALVCGSYRPSLYLQKNDLRVTCYIDLCEMHQYRD